MLIMASMQNRVALVKHCNSFSATTIWRKFEKFFVRKLFVIFANFGQRRKDFSRQTNLFSKSSLNKQSAKIYLTKMFNFYFLFSSGN